MSYHLSLTANPLKMLLHPHQRTKLDETDDTEFYSSPRFVTHVDAGFIQQLGDLYRDRLPPNARIFDMMSSWVSHLPEDLDVSYVEGHGMNAEELARNPRLDRYFIQDLNQNPQLPLGDRDFDAVLNCASIQYLQYPEAVFSELYRILKPGGVAIVSFSNRMFYQKAIQVWRDGTDASHIQLVKSYFQSVPGFSCPDLVARPSSTPGFLQILGFGSSDPFYAVISQRESK